MTKEYVLSKMQALDKEYSEAAKDIEQYQKKINELVTKRIKIEGAFEALQNLYNNYDIDKTIAETDSTAATAAPKHEV